MTKEEAKIYFKQCNSRIISVCKDENKYDYEKQEIISNCARRTYEANRLAIKALEQEPIHDILDKIRAEITDWQNDIHDNENDADEHDFVFERIFEIFDEYTSESDGKENEN